MPPSIDPGIPRLPAAPPSGWKRCRLGDLFDVVERPVVLEPSGEYELVVARRSRKGIESRGRLRGSQIKVKQQFGVEADDFLMSNRQISHGGCGIVPQALAGAIVSGEYTVLHPKTGLLLEFLGHYTHSRYFQQICFHSSVGVHVEKLVFRPTVWMNWPIDLPDETEQRWIAGILSECDRAISATEALVAAKRHAKRALMQRLLLSGDFTSRLSDIAEINPGTDLRTVERLSFVAMEDVSEDGHLSHAHDRDRHRLGSGYTPFKEGDTLVAKITPCFENGKGAFAAGLTNGHGLGSTEFHVLRARDGNHPRFIYHLTRTTAFRLNGERHMTGSAGQRRVPADFLATYPVPKLSPPEQAAAAKMFDLADQEVALLAAEIDALRRQKRGLMQKLLSGQWRGPAPAEKGAAE